PARSVGSTPRPRVSGAFACRPSFGPGTCVITAGCGQLMGSFIHQATVPLAQPRHRPLMPPTGRLSSRQELDLRPLWRRGVRLASILGTENRLRSWADRSVRLAGRGEWCRWQMSAGREAEAQGPVVPPGDGDFEVGEAGVDEDGVVAAQVEGA